MATCPKCGKNPIRRKKGVRKCKRCGPLPDPSNAYRQGTAYRQRADQNAAE